MYITYEARTLQIGRRIRIKHRHSLDMHKTRVGHATWHVACLIFLLFFLKTGHAYLMATTRVSLQGTQKRHSGVQFTILKNIFRIEVKNYKFRNQTKISQP